MRALLAAVLAVLLLPAAAHAERYGTSAAGRALSVERVGDPAAPTAVLVIGSIHGNETAGHAVVARLHAAAPPAGVRLLLVRTANPDGVAAGTRQNARGVDLNRNFPRNWRAGGSPFGTYFPGRRPASEPETRALQRLVRAERPALTISYHQALALVDVPGAGDPALARAYARRVGLPARRLAPLPGTATAWLNTTFPDTTAFVVELPSGPLTARAAVRHARAVLALAAGRAVAAQTAAPPKPRIVWSPIPFGRDRIRQMRRYSTRHYGDGKAKLADPHVIVEHYTATSSYGSAWNTFAANVPDVEYGERPGVCAHFIVDRDGTIHQLVALKWRCRHTVGLNQTAIGIEHVGVSDGEVMGRPAQLAASLALTRWLQARYGIRTRDVIGHAESLRSPYHEERVAAMRSRTHGDFAAATMKRYRGRL
jgi:N-acetylmuramoyl-L-alanine amidase